MRTRPETAAAVIVASRFAVTLAEAVAASQVPGVAFKMSFQIVEIAVVLAHLDNQALHISNAAPCSHFKGTLTEAVAASQVPDDELKLVALRFPVTLAEGVAASQLPDDEQSFQLVENVGVCALRDNEALYIPDAADVAVGGPATDAGRNSGWLSCLAPSVSRLATPDVCFSEAGDIAGHPRHPSHGGCCGRSLARPRPRLHRRPTAVLTSMRCLWTLWPPSKSQIPDFLDGLPMVSSGASGSPAAGAVVGRDGLQPRSFFCRRVAG